MTLNKTTLKTRPKTPNNIDTIVKLALKEDIGDGDRTCQLIKNAPIVQATLISRQSAVLCGTAWFNKTLENIIPNIDINWQTQDGDDIHAGQTLCVIKGNACGLLSAERTAINFLQTLSGTASVTRLFQQQLQGLSTVLLDTRKTLPGLRSAQKYAVACGGGVNHRMGLYDRILLKENHILAAGGIMPAIKAAQQYMDQIEVEVEVESISELLTVLSAGVTHILLDNFHIDMLKKAVELTAHRAQLEASGNIDKTNIRAIAKTGVDFISIGALTKNIEAIDFSMRIEKRYEGPVKTLM